MAKWTDELVQELQSNVGDSEKVTATEVEEIADKMELTYKEVAGKLRSLGYGVGKKEEKTPAYSDKDEEKIKKLVSQGKYIEEIAEALNRSVPQIRGKLLSMKLKAPQKVKKEKVKVYTDEVVKKIEDMYNKGIKSGKEKDTVQKEIADKLSLNLAGLKSQMTKLGITEKAHKPKFWTEEKIKEATDMFYNTTETLDVIAEKLGTTYPLLAKVLKQQGIDYEARKPQKKQTTGE